MNESIVMVVEDDNSLREAIVETLKNCGHMVVEYDNGMDALSELTTVKPSLVISDVQMNGIDGMDLMASILKKDALLPVILITAYGTVEKAVDAIKSGAKDYLLKPFEPEVLNTLVMKHMRDSVQENEFQMIASDKIMINVTKLAARVAKSNATVMITGESGTGKEVLSRFIHINSPRKDKPFIAINCAAIPSNMLEATLFGYEKGAFTGAYQLCPGKFELAQDGTILLDEITEMELSLQAKILRVLQEREVERIGGKKTIPLNVRVIATSNRDMKQEVSEGKFREDLYYRLNVFPLRIPSLSERKGDIEELSYYLVKKWSRLNKSSVDSISEGALRIMEKYSWPGNVRELDNVIQRAIILADNNLITENELCIENEDPETIKASNINNSCIDIKGHEYRLIQEVLESVSWSRRKAAIKLGISERTLRYKMSKMRESGFLIHAS